MGDERDWSAFWSEVGRRRVAGRRRELITCAVCGRQVEAYPGTRFCSATCRVKAHRRARKAREPGEALLPPGSEEPTARAAAPPA